MTTSFLRLLCGVTVLAASIDVSAELPEDVGPATPVQAEGSPDVYLNDSFEATDAVAQADRLARARRWEEAARVLQGVATVQGNKLIRISSGYYVSVRRHVADRLAAWPAEGIAAYRAAFENEMRDQWSAEGATRSLSRLLVLLDLYFCTQQAVELADTIGQLAIESGELALAGRVYRRMWELHPDRTLHESRWRAMALLADAMRGRPPKRLTPSEANSMTQWMGEARSLEGILEEIRARFDREPRQSSTPTSDWPILGGNTRRSRQGASDIDTPGMLWRAQTDAPFVIPDNGDEYDEFDPRLGASAAVMNPTLSGQLMLLQQGRQVWALHRDTGAEVWRFHADAGRTSTPNEPEEIAPSPASVTAHEDRIYATLPGDSGPYYSYEPGRVGAELVCLDRRTGRVVWRIGHDASGESFSELYFDPSPLVTHGRVYLVGRRRRSFGFEDCYLYCFRASDGAVQFRTHLGSASMGSFGSRQSTVSIPAMAGDTVFVCTNLGSVAAVAAGTGSVRWLRLYERNLDQPSSRVGWAEESIRPWEFNPVMLSDRYVVCLPNDSDRLLVLAEADGRQLHAVSLETVGGMRTLLGIRDDVVCGSGSGVACYDLAGRTLRWATPMTIRDRVRGRGAWSADRLLVPTTAGLSVFNVIDGARTDWPWDAEGEPGNVVSLADRLIVAGARSVTTYLRKEEIWTALRQRLAESASDPAPALDLAEVAFGGGETVEALTALAEAMRRIHDAADTVTPDHRARLFTDAISFARKLSGRAELQPDDLSNLLRYASRCASDPADHLHYRVAFARLFETNDDSVRALDLYRQILRDRSLRELPHDAIPGSISGGKHAARRIAALIELHGRELYAPVEAEAARRLEAALRAGDEQALARIVEAFPNAHAAPKALTALGSLLADAGRAMEAARRFAAAYHRYPAQVDRPDLLWRIAESYERAEMWDHAYAWLTKAAHEYPTATVRLAGRRMRFGEVLRRWEHVRGSVKPSRPRVTLPLEPAFTRRLPEGAELLTPQFKAHPKGDWSSFYLHTPDGITAHEAAGGAERWHATPYPDDTALLLATADVAVFKTLHRVFALDAATGSERWSFGRRAGQKEPPPDDWEDAGFCRANALARDRLVVGCDDGTLACIRVSDGTRLWTQAGLPPPAGSISIGFQSVVYDTIEQGSVVLYRLGAEDGNLIARIDTRETHAVEELLVTLDDRIVMSTSRSLTVFDVDEAPPTAPLWRVDSRSRLFQGTLVVDVDAVYVSDDARTVKKMALDTGKVRWQTGRFLGRDDDHVAAHLLDGNLIVSSTASVTAFDAVTGVTLWRGTTPHTPRMLSHWITDAYVLALDIRDEGGDAVSTAFFYDHRNASGVIPRDGGALLLAGVHDIRAALPVDGGLLVQTGLELHAWGSR